MNFIDFTKITSADLLNPRMKRAYFRYIKKKEEIAVASLLSLKNYNRIIDKTYINEIIAWENGEKDTLSANIKGILPQSCKPVFQICMENLVNKNCNGLKFTTILEKTDDYLVIVPAGFKPSNESDNATVNSMNPPSVRLGGNASLMAIVHLLVIPTKRIYNGITVKKEDIPLLRAMQQAGKFWYKVLCNKDSSITYSKNWILEGNYLINGKGKGIIQKDDMSKSVYTDLNKKIEDIDIETTFHLYPNQSIGWLHMHIFSKVLATTGYDLHGYKNVPVSDIINNLQNN